MVAIESTLLALLVILSFGLMIPELFKRLHLPFVTLLIIIGAVLGPNTLGYVETTETIEFFGFLGMTFIMLMAGLETDVKKLVKSKGKIATLALINGFIPFLTGVLITRFFGYGWLPSLLIGIIFISSSIAIAIPTLKSAGLFHKTVGQLILSAVLVADIVSLLLLSIVLQEESHIARFPLPLHFIILILSVIATIFFIPKLARYLIKRRFSAKEHYEKQLRFVIMIIIAGLLFFFVLGVHPILAAFILGITLAGVIKSEHIFSKIYTFGYGFFVPVFFFIVGMQMDLSILKQFDLRNVLMISIIFGLIISKFVSGFVAGKLIKLSNKDSATFGAASIVQLTTTLAVTYAASSIGILDSTLVTSVIMLSLITTILGPIVLNSIVKTKNN